MAEKDKPGLEKDQLVYQLDTLRAHAFVEIESLVELSSTSVEIEKTFELVYEGYTTTIEYSESVSIDGSETQSAEVTMTIESDDEDPDDRLLFLKIVADLDDFDTYDIKIDDYYAALRAMDALSRYDPDEIDEEYYTPADEKKNKRETAQSFAIAMINLLHEQELAPKGRQTLPILVAALCNPAVTALLDNDVETENVRSSEFNSPKGDEHLSCSAGEIIGPGNELIRSFVSVESKIFGRRNTEIKIEVIVYSDGDCEIQFYGKNGQETHIELGDDDIDLTTSEEILSAKNLLYYAINRVKKFADRVS